MAYIIALSILAIVPLILVWPYVGILAWFWVGLMNPHRWAWGPLETLGYAAIIGAVTLLAWMISSERKRIPVNGVTMLLGLFLVWITITSVMARMPSETWASWNSAFKILLITFVTIALVNTRERLHALVWMMVVGLGYYGFKGGVFTVLTGGEYHVFGPPKSFIGDNNQLALALIMLVPFIVYLQRQSANFAVRMGLIGLGITCVFSIVGSQSRGAFLAVSVMAAFLLLKSRQRIALGFAVVGLVLVSIWFVPDSWVERMETIQNYEEDNSAQARLRAWTFAAKTAINNPLTGGGFNVFLDENYFKRLVPNAPKVTNFHSVYFEVLGEQGFIGLFIFLALFVATWTMFGRIMRTTRDRPELTWAHELARMAQVSLVGYACAGAFLNLAFYDLYYLIVAFAPITWSIVQVQTGESLAGARAAGRRNGRMRGRAVNLPEPEKS